MSGPAYCSYISGICAHGNDVRQCAKRNVIECRTCRQKNEAKQEESEECQS
jgi:hypothetical protein